MKTQQPASDSLLAQLKAIPPSRTLILATLICCFIGFSLWKRELQPLTEEIATLQRSQTSEETFLVLEQTQQTAGTDRDAARAELTEKQAEVQSIADKMGIPVTAGVYAEAVSAINHLVNINYLKLVQYDGKKALPQAANNNLGQFTQNFIVSGSFPDTMNFLEHLDRLPYLCKVTVQSLTSESHRDGTNTTRLQFEFTLYYMQGNRK